MNRVFSDVKKNLRSKNTRIGCTFKQRINEGYNLLSVPLCMFLLQTPSKENIETLSALEIAEQMTYIDHQIFISISSE